MVSKGRVLNHLKAAVISAKQAPTPESYVTKWVEFERASFVMLCISLMLLLISLFCGAVIVYLSGLVFGFSIVASYACMLFGKPNIAPVVGMVGFALSASLSWRYFSLPAHVFLIGGAGGILLPIVIMASATKRLR